MFYGLKLTMEEEATLRLLDRGDEVGVPDSMDLSQPACTRSKLAI